MTTPSDQPPLTILIAADTYPPHINGPRSSATVWPTA
ncbi:type 1 capsular polysaccharide biosynthesis protein J [Arthrobacter sp. Hiyo4]|nr:type 1 capsular polysaccharide biosynthesis protein J [Arthrobacter sp. Hiyo4]